MDDLVLSRPEQLQALGDPTRWRILGRLIGGPASIQQLARALGVAKGTIGHHVGVLESAGLIRLAETHRVRGVTEKRYARTAGHFRFPDDDAEREAVTGGDANVATLPLRAALAEARAGSGPDDPSTSVVVRARMPAARARRFAALVESLAAEFVDGAPGTGEAFGFVVAVYVPDWAAAEREGE